MTTTTTTLVYDDKATFTQASATTASPNGGQSARIFADDEFSEHDMPREMTFDEMPDDEFNGDSNPNSESDNPEVDTFARNPGPPSSSARLLSENEVPARTVAPFRSLPLSPANRARVLNDNNGEASTRSPTEAGFDDESADTGFDDGFGEASSNSNTGANSNRLIDTTTAATVSPSTRPSIFLRPRPELPRFSEPQPAEEDEPDAEFDSEDGDDAATEIPSLFNFGDRLRNLRTVRKVNDQELAKESAKAKKKDKPCNDDASDELRAVDEDVDDYADDEDRQLDDLVDYSPQAESDYVSARDYFDDESPESDEKNATSGELKQEGDKEVTTSLYDNENPTTAPSPSDRQQSKEQNSLVHKYGTESRIKRFVVRPGVRVRLDKSDVMSVLQIRNLPTTTTSPTTTTATPVTTVKTN